MHVLELIQTHRMKSGLAISPNTPASSITDEMGNKADLLLVMTVHPGRGGQKFMPECLKKVEELRQRFPGKNIQVDGGVGKGNACQCAQAGEFMMLRVLPFSDQMTPNRLLRICGRRSMVLLRKLPRERARRVPNHRVSGQHL
jgi:pentose-5-phosphate-3-epimerase